MQPISHIAWHGLFFNALLAICVLTLGCAAGTKIFPHLELAKIYSLGTVDQPDFPANRGSLFIGWQQSKTQTKGGFYDGQLYFFTGRLAHAEVVKLGEGSAVGVDDAVFFVGDDTEVQLYSWGSREGVYYQVWAFKSGQSRIFTVSFRVVVVVCTFVIFLILVLKFRGRWRRAKVGHAFPVIAVK